MLNPYKALLGLLPDTPLQVGDVISIGGGVAVIEVPGGGQVAARGEAAVGQRAFFRDGVIEGVAPDLTIVEVEI